jgi:hypothetical protein
MKKYYDILGLEEGASKQAIQEAYDRLSVELDPKKNNNHDFFIEEFQLLQEAYGALINNTILPKSNNQITTNPINRNINKPKTDNNFGLKNDIINLFSGIKLIYIIIAIIFILLLIKKCNSVDNYNGDNYNGDNSDIETPNLDTSFVAPVDTTASFADTTSVISDNIEFYETPENGFSPYDGYFGQGVYEEGTNNEFVIKNSNESDVVVCLVDYNSGTKIRNEFIRKGSSFKMSNVPNSTYYLAWFSGNDWSPYKIMMGNVEGGFQTDANFSKSDGPSDLMECYGDRRWTITLYSVVNGNMNQTEMSENDFFKPSP